MHDIVLLNAYRVPMVWMGSPRIHGDHIWFWKSFLECPPQNNEVDGSSSQILVKNLSACSRFYSWYIVRPTCPSWWRLQMVMTTSGWIRPEINLLSIFWVPPPTLSTSDREIDWVVQHELALSDDLHVEAVGVVYEGCNLSFNMICLYRSIGYYYGSTVDVVSVP